MRALITGASKGIGRALADALSNEDWEVLCLARGHLDCAPRVKRCLTACVTTLTREMFTEPLDAVICCAAQLGPLGPAMSTEGIRQWQRTYEVNVIGTWRTICATWPMLTEGARIITFAGGGDGHARNCAAYASSKAAVVRFTECLALEAQDDPRRLSINCVSPGPVETEMWSAMHRAGLAPIGFGPDKVIDCVKWLLSEESRGITGRWIAARWDDYRDLKPGDLTTETWRMRRLRAPNADYGEAANA